MIPPPLDNAPEALYRQERAFLLNLGLAVAFTIPAVIVAAFSGSLLLFSDLLDHAQELINGVLGWNILRAIRKGRTQGFDYGTGKLQTLGGVIGTGVYVAALLFMAAMAIRHLVYPAVLDQTYTAAGAVLQMAGFSVDFWLWRRNRRLAREAFSPVMETLWRANRADALSCLAVLLGLGLTLALRRYHWSVYVDPACALAFVTYAGLSFLPVLSEGIGEMLDKTLREDLQLRIDRHLAQNYDGYAGFHGVRSRRSAGRIFIEIALSFPPGQTVAEAVQTIERLRRGIEADIPGSEVRVVLMPAESDPASQPAEIPEPGGPAEPRS